MQFSNANVIQFTREIDQCWLATPESDTEMRAVLFALKRKWVGGGMGVEDLRKVEDVATARGDRGDVLKLVDSNRFLWRRAKE